MAKYELRFKKSVAKDLKKIPNRDVKAILNRIDLLTENPRDFGCTKLAGDSRYRVRLGVYRILYEIADTELIIYVVKVAHRSKVYKKPF
jgi:mRNA interferase RelE/StbE